MTSNSWAIFDFQFNFWEISLRNNLRIIRVYTNVDSNGLNANFVQNRRIVFYLILLYVSFSQ